MREHLTKKTGSCWTAVFLLTLLSLISLPLFGQSPQVQTEETKNASPPPSLEAPEAEWDRAPGGEVHQYSELPPDAGEAPRKKKESFPGYTKHKERFRVLCENLYEDDRALVLSVIGESHKGGAIGCAACKTFFRLLYSQCSKVPKRYKEITNKIGTIERTLAMKERPKKTKKAPKKKGNEQEVKTKEQLQEELNQLRTELPRKQLEPRLSVIDSALRLSQSLADELKLRDEHYKAIEILAQDLMSPVGKTTGERNYFDTFVTYLLAPFAEYAEQRKLRELLEQRKADQRAREFMFDSNQMFGGPSDGEGNVVD